MRHFCDIGLHNCNFLLDYNDLTLQILFDNTECVMFYNCVVATQQNHFVKGRVFFKTEGQVSVQYLKIYV